jgi:hypothetical protein
VWLSDVLTGAVPGAVRQLDGFCFLGTHVHAVVPSNGSEERYVRGAARLGSRVDAEIWALRCRKGRSDVYSKALRNYVSVLILQPAAAANRVLLRSLRLM